MEELIEAIAKERRRDLLLVIVSDKFVTYDRRRESLAILDKLNELGVRYAIGKIDDDWMLCKVKRRRHGI